MTLIADVKIVFLKKRARALLSQIRHREDEFDCGGELRAYLAPDLTALRHEFNAVLDQLSVLDPNTPHDRLL